MRLGWPCLFGRGPSVGVAAPAGLPVGLGALGAPGLAQDGGLAAVPAYAEFLGLLPLFLGVVPVILLALWSLGPALVVRPPFLLAGFHLFWGRLDPRPRLPGLRCGFGSGLLPAGRLLFGLGFSGSWLAWRGGFLGLCPALGLLEWEAIDEYLSFRRTHPRWRGVCLGQPAANVGVYGSSPLARGLPRPAGCKCRSLRFIPAGAGSAQGSSIVRRSLSRFIPAGAGSAEITDAARAASEVHPRWRGVCGLPPIAALRCSGFIPAPAGSARNRGWAAGRPAVHPRSRGVCRSPDRFQPFLAGSSPLPRGLRPVSGGTTGLPGFIPAPAGSAPSPSRALGTMEVHPRSRGVCDAWLPANRVSLGSSPLPRGLHRLDSGQAGGPGFIPAPAGSALRA